MNRRQFAGNLGMAFGTLAIGAWTQKSWGITNTPSAHPVVEQLRQIEAKSGGRLGVAIFDSHSGQTYAYRGGERFPMCSTFKLLASAFVLKRVDQGKEQLTRRIRYQKADLVPYSPVTEHHTGAGGMTVAELCEAAITQSDNTAANLLLHSFGGPAQLTAYMRLSGDKMTRLDRIEPHLNEAAPGDPRDTTTPSAMVSSLREILLGGNLSGTSRQQLTDWLLANKTGDKRLRALLPSGWRVADKTGTGDQGTANDIGMLLSPDGAPLLVASYLTGAPGPAAARDAVHAQVGRLAASLITQQS
ncbi:MAG: class A beta-lactamase [Collimonas pratensis]|uniref:class A beta-lactamase n=1 Tax=Collimonas pratensis TaxID=279113 RepID=UPI003C71C40E